MAGDGIRHCGPVYRLAGRRPPDAPWHERLSTRQQLVVAGLRDGESPQALAARLAIRLGSVRKSIQRIAAHLPGDLPAQVRVTVWARGGADALSAPARTP